MAKYDKPMEEDEEKNNSAALRLPFALCKKYGIQIQKWWRPRDAWNALNGVKTDINPQEEMRRLFEKKERSKISAQNKRQEEKERKKQAIDPQHSPDYQYEGKEGEVAGVKKGNPMSFEKADGKSCNPYFNGLTKEGNPLFGYRTNCQTCVVAFEARLRGYDVRALPNNRNPYIKDVMRNTSLAWVDENGNHPFYQTPRKNERKMKFLERVIKDGERYTLEFEWLSARSGHIVSVERVNGKIRVYDPQTGEIRNTKELLSKTKNLEVLRIDNCQFNTEYVNYMLKGVEKNGKKRDT